MKELNKKKEKIPFPFSLALLFSLYTPRHTEAPTYTLIHMIFIIY